MRSAELLVLLDAHPDGPASAAAAIATQVTSQEELADTFGVILRFGVLRPEQAEALLRAFEAVAMHVPPSPDAELQELQEAVAMLEKKRHDLQQVERERADLIAHIDQGRLRISQLTAELAASGKEAQRIEHDDAQLRTIETEVRKWISPRS
jgi:septal ring factor EnvC (AmiA/AmiB activator)